MPSFRGKRVNRPNSLGTDLGGAMADALKPLGYASKPLKDPINEDDSGLIPSDRFVQALGASLEAKGYRRL